MQVRTRPNWQRHVKRVVRSKHYSWLAEARDGEPLETVMTDVLTDVRHICQMQGVSFQDLLEHSGEQADAEQGMSVATRTAVVV